MLEISKGTDPLLFNKNCCTRKIGWQTRNQRGDILLYNFRFIKVTDKSWQFDLADKDRTLVTRSPCPVSQSRTKSTCHSECAAPTRGMVKSGKVIFPMSCIVPEFVRIDWRRIRVSTSCQSVNGNIRIDTHLAFPHSDWSDGSHSGWSERSVVPTYPSPNPLETSSSAPLPHHLHWSLGPRSLPQQKRHWHDAQW